MPYMLGYSGLDDSLTPEVYCGQRRSLDRTDKRAANQHDLGVRSVHMRDREPSVCRFSINNNDVGTNIDFKFVSRYVVNHYLPQHLIFDKCFTSHKEIYYDVLQKPTLRQGACRRVGSLYSQHNSAMIHFSIPVRSIRMCCLFSCIQR